MSEKTLGQALDFAQEAHAGQVDKAGHPYFGHILRVLAVLLTEQLTLAQLHAVILHDVIEDTSMTAPDLAVAGFSRDTIELVLILTRSREEKYMDYIERVSRHPTATLIKIGDIFDNTDTTRLKLLPNEKGLALARKYLAALDVLSAAYAAYLQERGIVTSRLLRIIGRADG